MNISKDLKKVLICGASLVMIASLGSGINNVSAKRTHRYHYRTSRVYRHRTHRSKRARYLAQRKAQYKGLVHYLNWLNWYDGHHANKMNTWKARHLYYFMNKLTRSQKQYLMGRLARVNNNWREHKAYLNKQNNQYNNVSRYLRWVNRYDAHHTHKFNSWKLRHLNKYMNYLSASQKNAFNKQARHLNKLVVKPIKVNRAHHNHKVAQSQNDDGRSNPANVGLTDAQLNQQMYDMNHQSDSELNQLKADAKKQGYDFIDTPQEEKAEQAKMNKENQEATEAGKNAPTIHEHTHFVYDKYANKTPLDAYVTKGDDGQPIVEQYYGNGNYMDYGAFNNGTKGLNDYNNFKKYQQENPAGAKAWLMDNHHFSGLVNE